jgi:nucleoside-diphosphate-sugar epimerase
MISKISRKDASPRPAATYAEGASVLHSFRGNTTYLDRLRKGKPIIVHGDGQSLWCSCHASDVARAFVNAACQSSTYGKTYHVTSEEFLTWNQHHQMVARALGAPEPQLVHIPTDLLERLLPERAHWTATNFQYNNSFDNTAAKQDLDFRYTIRWEEGARRLVAWLDAHGKIENSDDDPFDDQLIALWERMCADMAQAWTKTNFR